MVKKSYRSDMHRRQRTKNFALLIALLAFVIIVFFVSLVRMGGL
jgi:hypothetical protein